MGVEIERKFLVADERWRDLAAGEGRGIRQFYLAAREGFSARMRIVDEARAVLTLKTGSGLSRGEYEYEIPLADAVELEAVRQGITVKKRRHRIDIGGGLVAEVDVFEGALAPLVLAEVELPEAEHAFDRPDWLGQEVTDDPAYTNARMALAGSVPARRPR